MEEKSREKINQATKWSTITEIGTKLVTPITNAILARLLAPEVFGVVATLTMVISFAEIFTDAGFQKYLVQHEFCNQDDLDSSTNVAFWTNTLFSFVIWGVIALFATPIAALVGSAGHEMAVIVMSAEIPILAFSSIQMARFRRVLDFKKLFYVRIVGSLSPILITIPTALIWKSYWALVVGTLAKDVLNAVILTALSPWKPRLMFSLSKLKTMLSYSIWTVFESITIWLSGNAGIFIIGSVLGSYYLGLYKTTINTVNGCFNIIQGAILPVMFAALSRCQENEHEFKTVYSKFQRMMALLIFPLGFGIYVYRELATWIFLGEQWLETADLFGFRSLTHTFLAVFSYCNSEAFRSKGFPHMSTLAQILYLIIYIPVLYWSCNCGYGTLVIVAPLSSFVLLAATSVVAHYRLGIKFSWALKNVYPSLVSALIMSFIGYLIRTIYLEMIWELFTVVICMVVYTGIMYLIPEGRKQLAEIPILNRILHINV